MTAAVPAAPSLAPTKPGRWNSRVVVRAEDDRRPRPGSDADDVAQARVAGDGLEAPAGQQRPQPLGERAQRRRARGPRADARPARGGAAIARSASKRSGARGGTAARARRPLRRGRVTGLAPAADEREAVDRDHDESRAERELDDEGDDEHADRQPALAPGAQSLPSPPRAGRRSARARVLAARRHVLGRHAVGRRPRSRAGSGGRRTRGGPRRGRRRSARRGRSGTSPRAAGRSSSRASRGPAARGRRRRAGPSRRRT